MMSLTLKQAQEAYKGRQWYRQRFDGSPLFLHAIAEAELEKEDRKPGGTEADVRISFFEEGKGDWYLDMNDIQRGAQALVELAKHNPMISKELLAQWKEDEQAFEHFFWKEFPLINLEVLTADEFTVLWNRYWALFHERTTSSSVIDHFALGTDELIQQMLKNEVGETERVSQFSQIFSTLTAPVHQSFINTAEIELLRIMTHQSQLTVEQYQQQYFWTMNNYVRAHIRTVEEIQQEMEAWNASGRDLQHVLYDIETTPKNNRVKKEELLSTLHLSSHLKTMLQLSEDFTWWQDERKKATYFNIHMGAALLNVLAKKTRYNVEDLKYTQASEIPLILHQHGPSNEELTQRRQQCVWIWTREGNTVFVGKAAHAFQLAIMGEKDLSDVRDVRGLSASMGKAVGRACIITSSTECDKVQQGDVVIAVMTRPDYVPAMKKACAIVTDEGGITSHAAIVSRELGIPCIIGTKIATKVFTSGEQVEVNANHGWARKVA